MKDEKTIPISIRIPKGVYLAIQREAEQKNTQFSKVAVKLMHDGINGLDPAKMARLQNVLNMSVKAAMTGSMKLANEAQKGADELWKSLK